MRFRIYLNINPFILVFLLLISSCIAVHTSYATSLEEDLTISARVSDPFLKSDTGDKWEDGSESSREFLVDNSDYIRRDQYVNQASKFASCCYGLGVACISACMIQENPLYQIGTALAGGTFISVGSLIKHRADKAAEVFNGINGTLNKGSELSVESRSWKDGTYDKVDRYPITPLGISWDQALQSTNLEANYSVQFMKFIAYRFAHSIAAKEPTEQEIIKYALNSTILTLLNVDTVGDHIQVQLDIKDLSSPFFKDGRKTDLFVNFEIPEGDYDLHNSKIVAFEFDGIDISKRSEQLLVLSTVTALYIHPLLHSFANNLYIDYRKMSLIDREKWNDIFLHGQYLNSVAHTYPADHVGIDRDIAFKIYTDNVSKDLHAHGKAVMVLSSYSRFSRFLLKIRKTIYGLVKKHEVPVNPEVFFLTSVMHSLDHLTTGKTLLYRNLQTEKLSPQAHPYLQNYMWYLPSENVFTNLLKDKRDKNYFYRELYDAAKSFDEEYADHLTLSISY
ncbi:MAG: hypothetical protein AB8G05_15675 [Oligoflexales bacterium]